MKRHITLFFLTFSALYATAQQQVLKPRPDAFPPIQETLNTKSINMATTVEQMADWDRYPTYPVYLQMMQRWVDTYPTLCHMDTIGTSLQGRLILSVYIDPDTLPTSLGEESERPEFFYSATIHGDELTGYIMMLRLIDTLLSSYGTSPELTTLMNTTRISINPLANPDGTYWGGDNSINGRRRYNAHGIDLNRHYPDPFNPSVKSVPLENQLMIDYLSAHNFRLSANLHGGAEVMNYPWDSFTLEDRPHPAAEWWQEVGRRFVDTAWLIDDTRFRDACQEGVIAGGDWYLIGGGRQDYVNYYHHCLEMTMEISLQKTLPCERLNAYWRLLAKSLINYIDEIHSLPSNIGIPQVSLTTFHSPLVYPNPTTGAVVISGLEPGAPLELLDPTGRVLQRFTHPHISVSYPENMTTVTLDLSSLTPGIYFLRTPQGTTKLLKR